MSLLDKAKKLARDSRAKHQKEIEMVAQREKERIEIENQTRNSVLNMLNEQLHHQNAFSVLAWDNNKAHGQLAVIEHEGKAIGFVCVNAESFKFDGSDECRDLDGWGIQITLKPTPQSSHVLAGNHAYIGHNQMVKDGVEAFANSLAEHLSRYF
jgi:single-stranded DNA-specific DHH superfamily exonuclease